MKRQVELIGDARIVQSNPDNYFNYFGWPSAARLQDGRIAVVSSGFRHHHVCPFGKAVISYSEDEGESFTPPAVVIDTPLDDRDVGIVPFGESNVILTSPTNNKDSMLKRCDHQNIFEPSYVENCVAEDAMKKYYGWNYRISHDCGKTFGAFKHAPVGTPHGPTPLPDGSLLWVGQMRTIDNTDNHDMAFHVFKMSFDQNGNELFSEIGQIKEVLNDDGKPLPMWEPHVIITRDGHLLCHIRADLGNECDVFTIFQCESFDGGATWTTPRRIIPILEGSTPHLFRMNNGLLLCTYEHRQPPFEIRAMFSDDEGKTWDWGHTLFTRNIPASWIENPRDFYPANDLGYPSTVALKDGTYMTFFYSRFPYPDVSSTAVIWAQKWQLHEIG